MTYQTYNVCYICQTVKLYAEKVEEFFCLVCRVLTSGVLTKSNCPQDTARRLRKERDKQTLKRELTIVPYP